MDRRESAGIECQANDSFDRRPEHSTNEDTFGGTPVSSSMDARTKRPRFLGETRRQSTTAAAWPKSYSSSGTHDMSPTYDLRQRTERTRGIGMTPQWHECNRHSVATFLAMSVLMLGCAFEDRHDLSKEGEAQAARAPGDGVQQVSAEHSLAARETADHHEYVKVAEYPCTFEEQDLTGIAVRDRLAETGIIAVFFGSRATSVYVPSERADDARSALSQLIEQGAIGLAIVDNP